MDKFVTKVNDNLFIILFLHRYDIYKNQSSDLGSSEIGRNYLCYNKIYSINNWSHSSTCL